MVGKLPINTFDMSILNITESQGEIHLYMQCCMAVTTDNCFFDHLLNDINVLKIHWTIFYSKNVLQDF